MSEPLLIVDSHVHFFSHVRGKDSGGRTVGAKFGKVAASQGVKPVFPPFLEATRFPVEMLVEVMDQHGIAKAVLLQNPLIGVMNTEVAQAVRRYPHRFVGTIQVDPCSMRAFDTLHRFASERQTALKLELSEEWGWSGIHPGFRIIDPRMDPIWQAVSDLRLQVIIDPGPIDGPGYRVDDLERITASLNGTTFVLEHLGYLQKETRHNPALVSSRQRYLALAKRGNVFLGLSAAASLLDDEYPCQATLGLLQEAVQLVGAEKIIWGTDAPVTMKVLTYRQMVDMVIKHAVFLSEDQIRLIMGANALRVFPAFAD